MTSSQKPEDGKLVFAIGLPRSGTSLLYALLNQHEHISLMYECEMFLLPFVGFASKFPRNWLLRLEFWNQALSRHGFKASPDLVQQIESPISLYRVYAARKKATIYGEKSPIYSARLSQLARRYPAARFIIIHREFSEIYRSVLDAAPHAPYFTKASTLRRLIYKQEKLIEDSARLDANGIALHRIHYTDLVNRTEGVCRAICEFLNIPIDPRMHVLDDADLSAVPPGAHHRQLRTRRIMARENNQVTLAPDVQRLIASFQKRWNRLLGRESCASTGTNAAMVNEPGWLTVVRYRLTGGLSHRARLFSRTVFEFAPLSWLGFYRVIKIDHKNAAHLTSGEFNPSRAQILILCLLSLLWLGGVAWMDYVAGPDVTFAPFYTIPVVLMTWHAGVRMGLLISFVAAVIWTLLGFSTGLGRFSDPRTLWNIAMRFLQLGLFVALLAEMRIRLMLREGQTPMTR